MVSKENWQGCNSIFAGIKLPVLDLYLPETRSSVDTLLHSRDHANTLPVLACNE